MIIQVIIFSLIAGITVLIGGSLAWVFDNHIEDTPFKPKLIHGMMSFGGGVLISAVALVLVPEGMDELGLWVMIGCFGGGAILFRLIDELLQRKGGQMGMLLAMLMDFIPESIALGAVFAGDMNTAILLAVFIGLQNLPEAFNSFREMVLSGFSAKNTLFIFVALSFSGVGGALLGFFFLSGYPTATAALMSFASGGILYLLVHDIIPESKLENSFDTSLGAVLGFALGIAGTMLV